MQKQLWAIVITMVGLFPVQTIKAQSFEKGKTFVSVGVGLMHIGQMYKKDLDDDLFSTTTVTRYQALPLALQIEYAASERWSFNLSTYFEHYEVDRNFIPLFGKDRIYQQNVLELLSFVARTNLHLGKKGSRFDPYFSGGLGITHLFEGQLSDTFYEKNSVTAELKLGGRYFLAKHLAAHIELGLGTILLQTGLTAKF